MTTPVEIELARARAMRLYPRSKGYRSVYLKGARAALQGKTSKACPYPPDPKKTWRAAWRLAWMRGHASVTRPETDDGR